MPAARVTAFLTKTAVAERLGVSLDTLRRRLPELRAMGFPEPHPVLSLYLAADVEAWLCSQARIAQAERTETPEVNYGAF
jgi:hypothetical protein